MSDDENDFQDGLLSVMRKLGQRVASRIAQIEGLLPAMVQDALVEVLNDQKFANSIAPQYLPMCNVNWLNAEPDRMSSLVGWIKTALARNKGLTVDRRWKILECVKSAFKSKISKPIFDSFVVKVRESIVDPAPTKVAGVLIGYASRFGKSAEEVNAAVTNVEKRMRNAISDAILGDLDNIFSTLFNETSEE